MTIQPDYTEEELQGLVGKRILAGITHCDLQGTTVSREQFHGIITRVTLRDGIVVKLNGTNELRTLPPDLSPVELARPGQYRLTNTDEVVEDPDYIGRWTIYPKGYKSNN